MTKTKFHLSKCKKCGCSAVDYMDGTMTVIACKDHECGKENRVRVIGPKRAAKSWNNKQKALAKAKSISIEHPKDPSGSAVSPVPTKGKVRVSRVVKGKRKTVLVSRQNAVRILKRQNKQQQTESDKVFDQRARELSDCPIAKADDTKVRVPAKVEVIDSKFGNVIGYRDAKEVFELIQNDIRFRQNVTQEGDLQLFYNAMWAVNDFIEINCETFDKYLTIVCQNMSTVIPCDDPRTTLLQCSYEINNRKFVANVPVLTFQQVRVFLHPEIASAIDNGTVGLIAYFKGHKAK